MTRFLLRGALLLAVVTVVAVVALKIFLPTDRLAALVAQRLRAATGAQVEYGEVSLDVWPRLALSVRPVFLRGPVQEPGPEGGVVSWQVQAAEIHGGLALGPLLARRAELDRVRLVRPVVRVETRPASRPATAAPGASSHGKAPWALVAAGATVEDGVVEWSEVGGRSLRLTGWDQEVDATELGRLAALLAAWAGTGPPPAAGTPGEIRLEGRGAELTLTGFRPGHPLVLKDLELAGRVVVPAHGPELGLHDLEAAWGGLRLTGAGRVTPPGPSGRLHVDWRLAEHDAAVVQAALAPLLPPGQEPLAAWLRSKPVTVPDLSAEGSLELPLPLPAGPVAASLLPGLRAEARIRGARVLPPHLTTPWDLAADLSLSDAQLRAENVKVRVGEGHLDGVLTVGHVGRPQSHASVEASFDGLPTALVLEALAPSAAPYLEGAAGGSVRGRFRVGDAGTVLGSLTLTGEAVLTDGVVHASEWLAGVSRYLGDRQDLKDIAYTSLRHRLEVADGRYMVRDLTLSGPDTDWSGGGRLGFDGTIDLDLRAKLPPGFTPDLGAMTLLAEGLRDADGRIVLDLTLTGRAARPTVGLDLGSAGAMLRKSSQDALDGEQGQELLKGVQGLLDKLKGRR